VTVTVAVPLCPSLVAVIVATPGAFPETKPLEETVAMAGSLEPHVTTRSVVIEPVWSCTTAVSCRLASSGIEIGVG